MSGEGERGRNFFILRKGEGWEMVGMPGRNNELARRRMDGERKSRIGKKKDRVEKTDKSPRRKGKKCP